MLTLLEYLERKWSISDIYLSGEYNEIIGMTYNVIRRAVREQSDTLILTDEYFSWVKNGNQRGQFFIDKMKPLLTVSFRESLDLILVRDKVLNESLHLISTSLVEVSYTIDLGIQIQE